MSEHKAGGPAPTRAIPRHGIFEIGPMLDFAGAPELAGRFGLSARELDDPDGMIPLPVLHALLEALVEVTGDAYFGLHFGASGSPSHFKRRVGALGLMLLSSPTMAAGMHALVRYQNLFNEGDRYSVLEHGSDTRIGFEPWGPERPGQIQMAEKTVAQILMLLSLAEPGISPRAIELAHAERADSEELTRTLGLAPKFRAGRTAVIVRTGDMQRPIHGADPDHFRFFDRHLTANTGETHDASVADGSAAALAREAVRHSLHRDVFSSLAIAEQLGLSPRTLQRRLTAEGTSLRAIVEDVRRARAESLLRAGMPVAEVAVMLGYSGTTAFVRAFRRWLGKTPAAVTGMRPSWPSAARRRCPSDRLPSGQRRTPAIASPGQRWRRSTREGSLRRKGRAILALHVRPVPRIGRDARIRWIDWSRT